MTRYVFAMPVTFLATGETRLVSVDDYRRCDELAAQTLTELPRWVDAREVARLDPAGCVW